jgi:hypothetical protein
MLRFTQQLSFSSKATSDRGLVRAGASGARGQGCSGLGFCAAPFLPSLVPCHVRSVVGLGSGGLAHARHASSPAPTCSRALPPCVRWPRTAPQYVSLRKDGRVRGSGMGCPPWAALAAQLPPEEGIWTGLLDGMDGKV